MVRLKYYKDDQDEFILDIDMPVPRVGEDVVIGHQAYTVKRVYYMVIENNKGRAIVLLNDQRGF